jgi:hypothetical protein
MAPSTQGSGDRQPQNGAAQTPHDRRLDAEQPADFGQLAHEFGFPANMTDHQIHLRRGLIARLAASTNRSPASK